PFQTRIDMYVLFSNNFLSALSQLVALLDDSQEGQTASATIGLIASILQLCATILLGVDLVLRRGGVMHASVGIQDPVQLAASAVPQQRLQHGGSTLDSRTHFFEKAQHPRMMRFPFHCEKCVEMISLSLSQNFL
ncbi:GPI-anchored surface protein, putative, partial [Bodo saltans]